MVKIVAGKHKYYFDAFVLLLFLYGVFIAINGVTSVQVMGIPLFSLFFLLFSFVVAVMLLAKINAKSKDFAFQWMFTLLISINFLVSVMKGWDTFSSLYNAFLYGTPFLLVALPSFYKIDFKKCVTVVRAMVLIGAAISILVYLGLIDSRMPSKALRVNIRVLDNSISLLGIIVSFYQILDDKHHGKAAYFYLVLSYLIAFLGQSRARIILALVISGVFLIYGFLKDGKKRGKTIGIVVTLFVVSIFLLNYYYDDFMQYLDIFLSKADTIMEDESSNYRIEEMRAHIELLREFPFTGIGSGALNHRYYTSVDTRFLGHCMLTSFWALNGGIAGSIMLLSLIRLLFKTVIMTMKQWKLTNVMALTLMGTIMFLATSSAGFAKYSTHIMMLILGWCLAKGASQEESTR